MCPGVGSEGRLRGLAYLLGDVVCRGHAQYLPFASNPLLLLWALQKWQWVFWSLCIFSPEFAQLHMQAVIFSPL